MAVSPNDTVVTGIGASVTDAGGTVWTIDPNGRITVNGSVDATTANVDALAYYNGLVWQKNAANNWYSKSSPAAAWLQWQGAAPPVPVPGVSPNDATIAAGGTASLVDANGNVWCMTKLGSSNGYQVSVDGAVDSTTANLVQMALVDGTIWQENTAGLWYSKTSPASPWSDATRNDPLTGAPEPISLTWVGGGNNNASNPAHWSPAVAPKPGDRLTMTSGTMNLSGKGLAGDILTISGSQTVTINTRGNAALNLDTVGSGAQIDINIAPGSTLVMTADISRSMTNISGGTLKFIGDNAFAAFKTVLTDKITGTGTVHLFGGNAAGESMEINGSVGSGLAFDISAPGPADAGLQIDRPSAFHAAVILRSGWVGFMGLHATRAELLDGVLEMFEGNKRVDAVRLSSQPNSGGNLQVEQNSKGVMVSVDIGDHYQPGGVGTLLPLRT